MFENTAKQNCIPVGCLAAAAVAFTRCQYLRVCLPTRGRYLPTGGGCQLGGKPTRFEEGVSAY